MKTRCKFQVVRVSMLLWVPNAEQVLLQAVGGTDGENASFAQYTPAGQLEITVTNPAVIGSFDLGGIYYLDLIPAE